METSLNVSDYPEPKEEKFKEVTVRANVTYEMTYEVPEKWEEEDIIKDVVTEFDYFNWTNEKIEEIEII